MIGGWEFRSPDRIGEGWWVWKDFLVGGEFAGNEGGRTTASGPTGGTPAGHRWRNRSRSWKSNSIVASEESGAAHHRGQLGLAAGRAGHGGLGRRRYDGPGGPGRLTPEHRTRLKTVWADGKYHDHRLVAGMKRSEVDYVIGVVSKAAGVKGFVLRLPRWLVERTFAWSGRCRRN